jgi:2,4-diaminopentanoate dehydrogenase
VDTPYRVIQWGSGFVGSVALRYLLPHPDVKLVGLKCYANDKVGVDAGDIADLGHYGMAATANTQELLELDAD